MSMQHLLKRKTTTTTTTTSADRDNLKKKDEHPESQICHTALHGSTNQLEECMVNSSEQIKKSMQIDGTTKLFDGMSQRDLFYCTSKIVELARTGFIASARKLFDNMPERDVITWNAMLTAYSQLGLDEEALSLFSAMRITDMKPDPFSFTAVLSASANAGMLNYGRKLHALIISTGSESSLPVSNSLIDMYAKCSDPSSSFQVFNNMSNHNEVSWCSLLFSYAKIGQFEHARQVFEKMPERNEIAWNIMITGYTRYGEVDLSMILFKEMQKTTTRADLTTFASLMSACADLPDPRCGRMIHACIIKIGLTSMVEASNSILSFYAKLEYHEDAVKAFGLIKIRTRVSWNAMIDAYMKVGDVGKALTMFEQVPEKDVMSWTAMIAGYARNGHGEHALGLFNDMLKSYIRPDDFVFGTVLHACANLALLMHGRMVHGCIIQLGFHSYVYVGNGLVNMYSKCGDIKGSCLVFDEMLYKDLVSWNAMLFGFGLHGKVEDALMVFEEMVKCGARPDKLTFIGLLVACSHAGLIKQGREYFDLMQAVYGLEPEGDHVACMANMLGRGGYLKEACKLVEDPAVNVTVSMCEALLGTCAIHGDVRLGRKVGEQLLTMEPQKELGYVLLSNLYCASGQWREAEKVRKAMANQGVRKLPGSSWIEVKNTVVIFLAGDCSHPQVEEIYKTLNLLTVQMRSLNFISVNLEAL